MRIDIHLHGIEDPRIDAVLTLLRDLKRKLPNMSQELLDAIANLKTEVGETLAAVQAKLAEIAGNTDDSAAAEQIREAAAALDDIQKGPLALSTPPEPPTEG